MLFINQFFLRVANKKFWKEKNNFLNAILQNLVVAS